MHFSLQGFSSFHYIFVVVATKEPFIKGDDTIFALATPLGKSAVAVLRVSGSRAAQVALLLFCYLCEYTYTLSFTFVR